MPYLFNIMSDENEFKSGDLAMLVSEFGYIIHEAGFVLVVSRSYGLPADLGETIKPEAIYTILLAGEVEKRVSGSWLIQCTDGFCILKLKEQIHITGSL